MHTFHEYVPGTTELRLIPDPDPAWMTNKRWSKIFHMQGPTGEPVAVRLYTIAALADALVKDPVTIRRWMSLGVLPESSWRTPSYHQNFKEAGRRLWSKDQIQALVTLATEEGVLGRKCRDMAATNFHGRIMSLWAAQGW